MSKDAAFGALIALIGALVGALMAVVPLQLIGARDQASRDVAVARILESEREYVLSYCRNLPRPNPTGDNVYTVYPPSVEAWLAATSNGDFIASVSPEEWTEINHSYQTVENLSGRVVYYMNFTQTQGAMSNYNKASLELLEVIAKQSDIVTDRFTNQLHGVLAPLRARLENKVRTLNTVILVVLGIGIILFIGFGYIAFSTLLSNSVT
jgi:hypothetical protein